MPYVPLPEGINEATCPDPENVPEVLDRLEAIQEIFRQEQGSRANAEELTGQPGDLRTALPGFDKIQDGVACFNHLYRVITADINNKIQQDRMIKQRQRGQAIFRGRPQNAGGEEPFFHNDEFLTKFDVAFAKRYLVALRSYSDALTMNDTPKCWRILFEHRKDYEISRMQFAVCGVIDHVFCDLAIAVVEVCKEMGRELDKPTHDDFQKVNLIFYEKIPPLRRHFESQLERDIDHWMFKRRFGNYLSDHVVKAARNVTWRHAEDLWWVWDLKENNERKMATEYLDNIAAALSRSVIGRIKRPSLKTLLNVGEGLGWSAIGRFNGHRQNNP